MDHTQIQKTLVSQDLQEENSWETYDSEEDDQVRPEPEHGDDVLRCVRRKCGDIS